MGVDELARQHASDLLVVVSVDSAEVCSHFVHRVCDSDWIFQLEKVAIKPAVVIGGLKHTHLEELRNGSQLFLDAGLQFLDGVAARDFD